MASGNRIVGVDLQIKQTPSNTLGAKDVDVVSIYVPLYYGYIFQNGNVRPCIAGGFGIGLNSINTSQMGSQIRGLVMEKSIASSVGFIGMAGVTFQASNRLALFVEYRHSFDFF
jgi:opacity protein-like surface antigen